MARSSQIQRATVALFGVLSLAIGCHGQSAERPRIPAPQSGLDLAPVAGKQTAVFAGGCFWGTQSVFERVKGVLATTVGYSGGSASTATYDQVSSETTGHAESVKVVYDPSKISYGRLLQIFFSVAHDPTQLDRQGQDVGTSYRSVIFYTSEEQRRASLAYIAELNAAHVFPRPIVTEVVPLKAFYDAESYHQHFADNHPENPYIQVCDRPKIAALRQQFPELFVEANGR